MRVDWAILCRFCDVNGGIATIVGAGIDTFWVPAVPATIAATVAVRVVGQDHEIGPGIQHTVVGRVLDPMMQEVNRLEFQFQAQNNPLHRPGWEGGFILPTVHQFEVTQDGPYTIDVAVDGQGYTVPLIVAIGPPPGGPPSSP